MKDYHVLSMDSVGGKVTDHGVALDIKDVPWAGNKCGLRMLPSPVENITSISGKR